MIFEKIGRGFIFIYNFGDNWIVPVEIGETFFDEKYRSDKYPRVLESKGYGGVENCGGVYRLADLAEAYRKKKGCDYEEFRDWLGVDNLDISAFNRKDINFGLKEIPKIYEVIYENWWDEPSGEDIGLVEREYMRLL